MKQDSGQCAAAAAVQAVEEAPGPGLFLPTSQESAFVRLRDTGIGVVGDVPWGTHLCQFYQDKQDLIDILVPYFKAGLENNEFCMWVTSEPLQAEEATAALAKAVGNLDRYLRTGQIEILGYEQWYTAGGKFESDRVLRGWMEKLDAAIARGFDGLRLSGNTFWLEKDDWRNFADYEAAVDGVIARYRMLAVCTYSLTKCGAAELLDVVANHAFALIKRGGKWDIIESGKRRRAEATLRLSEARYRSLFQNMSEGFAVHEVVTDADGKPCDYTFLDLNPAFERMTGLKRADLAGKRVTEVLPGIDREWIETYGTVALTGEPVHFERYYPAPLNRWFEISAYRPEPRQFAVVFMDVTARKREGEQLQKLNRTLRAHSRSDQALLRATDEASYLQEVCKIVVEDCGHAMAWVGYAEHDEGKTVRPVAFHGFEEGYLESLSITWADTERGRGPTGTAIRTGKPAVCRHMLSDPMFSPWRVDALRRGYASSVVVPLLKAGRAFGALSIYSREPDPFSEDEIRLLSGLADDIAYSIQVLRLRAAHAKAQQALRESEERFRLIADSMPNAVWTARPDGEIDYVNRHFRDYAGGDYELGMNLVHPDDRQGTVEGWSRAVELGQPYESEHRVRRFDGAYRWHLRRGVPVRDSQGQVVRWYGTSTDIHELRETQEQLRKMAADLKRSNEDLEQFAYVSSHDLQEPLRAVTGFVKLLKGEYAGKLDPTADRYIQYTVEGADRMGQLIDDLLAYSRVNTQAVKSAATDSAAAVRQAMANLSVGLEARGAQITIGQLPVVRADGPRLVQVFQNLIGNAIKFCGERPPQVHVDARREGDGWVFSVKDNGIGIAPEFHKKVFVIFQRLHRKPEYPGTGIGLAICKKIVERSGGRIWVESEVGEGATFHFSLPG